MADDENNQGANGGGPIMAQPGAQPGAQLGAQPGAQPGGPPQNVIAQA